MSSGFVDEYVYEKTFKIDQLESLTEEDLFTKFRYLFSGYLHSNHKRILTHFKKGIQAETQWGKIFNKVLHPDVSRAEQSNKIFYGSSGKTLNH